MIRIVGAALLFGIGCWTVAWAMDFSRMTNKELADLRDRIQNASPAEQSAFRQEWEMRLAAMPPEEKNLYSQQLETSPGPEGNKPPPFHVMGQGYENQGRGKILNDGERTLVPDGEKGAGK